MRVCASHVNVAMLSLLQECCTFTRIKLIARVGVLGSLRSMMELPSALRVPSSRELHGRVDTDDYAWMRDHEHPALREYLAAERAYYDEFASRLADLTKR